jgi:DnaA family protein
MPADRRSHVSQLILDFGPPPAAGFDNFVAGGNRECVAALRELPRLLAAGIAPPHRFIYVWGPPGSGKSHLAAALASQTVAQLTVVDDCQRLGAEDQRQLFHRFDALAQAADAALVSFGDAPPARLPVMPELASRLSWGIVFALEPLADVDLLAAMQRAAQERGLSLGADVPGYLLTHTRRDMASLKTIIDRLDRLSLEQKRPINLPMLRALLKEAPAPLPDRITG